MTDDAPSPTMNRTEHQKEIQIQTHVKAANFLFKSRKQKMSMKFPSCMRSLISVHHTYALHFQTDHSLKLLPVQTCTVRQSPKTLDLSGDVLPHGVFDV
jgi:hypothetical protein